MNLKIEKGIEYPDQEKREIVKFITGMSIGDSVFIDYLDVSKLVAKTCTSNARIVLAKKGLTIRSLKQGNGIRIWVFGKGE